MSEADKQKNDDDAAMVLPVRLLWLYQALFRDKTAPYPNDHFKIGRYLGLSIDIGPKMMAKVIKENGQVLLGSTYQALTQDEWEQEECKIKCSY